MNEAGQQSGLGTSTLGPSTLGPAMMGPSSLGEILDRTAALYRSRFLVFAGIAVIPTGSLLLFGAACLIFVAWFGSGGQSRLSPETIGMLTVAFFAFCGVVVLPIAVGVSSLSTAAMNQAVARAFFDEKPTIRGAYKEAWKRGWEFVGLYLLEGLAIWVVPSAIGFVALIVLTALGSAAGGAALGGFIAGLLFIAVIVALAVYVILALLRLSLAFPACVVEKLGPLTAIRRGNRLSEGTRGRMCLLYLLGLALSGILSLAMTIPITLVAALIPTSNNPERVQAASMILVALLYAASFATQALIRPVYGIALMLFYYDQRIRHEGFDIEWMMQRAGLITVPANPPSVPARYPGEFSPAPPVEDIPQTRDPHTVVGETS